MEQDCRLQKLKSLRLEEGASWLETTTSILVSQSQHDTGTRVGIPTGGQVDAVASVNALVPEVLVEGLARENIYYDVDEAIVSAFFL